MIKTFFWPSSSAEPYSWDTAINNSLRKVATNFPNIEIRNTITCNRRITFHNSNALEIAEHILFQKESPTIHFIQLCSNDIQEEHRDSFPESILHLDVLARLSRTHTLAVIDAIDEHYIDLKRQLRSVTFVEKTCTSVQSFPVDYPNTLPISFRPIYKRKIDQLTLQTLNNLSIVTNINKLTQEP